MKPTKYQRQWMEEMGIVYQGYDHFSKKWRCYSGARKIINIRSFDIVVKNRWILAGGLPGNFHSDISAYYLTPAGRKALENTS